MSQTAYIYEALRTPRSKGKADGALFPIKAWDLGAGLLRELQARHDLDTACVDDVIMGCVTPIGEQGGGIAKVMTQVAGWDDSVPGVQLNRYCASGLEAVNSAAQKVASGWEQLIVAGGIECMSKAPIGADGGAAYIDPDFGQQYKFISQGVAADVIASIEGYSRDDVDAYAVESQRRAAHAQANGFFDRSVITVGEKDGSNVIDKDDFLKPNTTMEILAGLNPSFEAMGAAGMDAIALEKYRCINRVNHVHTPGNSSGIVDGASAVLIGSEQVGKDLGLSPRARIVAGAVLSTDPTLMLAGPGPAAKKCLATAGMQISDIDLWEINEAFSSVAMRYMEDLDLDHEIVNVNGGAIAMGHPLGATGGMLIGTMLDELERRDARRGMVSLCVGLGMGISTIIERL